MSNSEFPSLTDVTGADDLIGKLGVTDDITKEIIRETVKRGTQIGEESVTATDARLAVLRIEYKALLATLATLGAIKAQQAENGIYAIVMGAIERLEDKALERIGL